MTLPSLSSIGSLLLELRLLRRPDVLDEDELLATIFSYSAVSMRSRSPSPSISPRLGEAYWLMVTSSNSVSSDSTKIGAVLVPVFL